MRDLRRFAIMKLSARARQRPKLFLLRSISIAYHPDRKTAATNHSCVQVRDSHDSVGPIYEDKDGNEEGQLVRQVHPLDKFTY